MGICRRSTPGMRSAGGTVGPALDLQIFPGGHSLACRV